MPSQVKAINEFVRYADKNDIKAILDNILLTERQSLIFEMKYVKGNDINFIADMLGCCTRVVDKELKHIRTKIAKYYNL